MLKVLKLFFCFCLFFINLLAQSPTKYAIKIGLGSASFPSISGNDTTKLASLINDVYSGYGNNFAISTGLWRNLNDKFSVGADIWLTSGKNYFLNLTSLSISANVKYNIISLKKHRVSPYLKFGLGLDFIGLEIRRLSFKNALSISNSKLNQTSLELLPAIGVDVRISNRVILYAELQHHNNRSSVIKSTGIGESPNLVYNSFSLGVRFNLGKIKNVESDSPKKQSSTNSKCNVKLVLIDAELPILLDAKLIYEDSLSANYEFKNERTGKYSIVLTKGSSYSIIVRKKFYKPYLLRLDLTSESTQDEFEKTISLEPIKREIQLQTIEQGSNALIVSDVEFVNLDMDEKLIPMVRDNKHTINVREGSRYSVEVKAAKGYFFNSEIIDLTTASASSSNDLKMVIKPIEVNGKLALKDILYKYNSEELIESSYKELARVIFLMKLNPAMKIEIGAHTDESGSVDYNLKLSERRANFVIDYLVKQGVETNRLSAKGYGKSKPVVSNDTEENRAKNRRLELTVLSK